jgi:acyl carrier protein
MIKAFGLVLQRTSRLSSASITRYNSIFGQLVKREPKPLSNEKSDQFKYVDGEIVPINHLVLHQRDSIEDYVFKMIKSYHRTTYRNGLTMESELSDHGLDSLDTMELVMQVEEDLGYKVSAENLSVFHKVKHFVNFIEQVENFKKTYDKDPLA